MPVNEQVFATCRNVSLGYPPRRVSVDPETVTPFASVEDAKKFIETHKERNARWEMEYTYGVEYLYSPE